MHLQLLRSLPLPLLLLHTAQCLLVRLRDVFGASLHVKPYRSILSVSSLYSATHGFRASPKCNLSRSFLIVVSMWAVRVRVGCMELLVTVVQGEPFLCTPGAVQIHPIWLIRGVGFLIETYSLHHPQELPACGVGWTVGSVRFAPLSGASCSWRGVDGRVSALCFS